jgi:tRNA threonylcarbamoyladenosine biosynthesis protein TsaB
VSAPDPRQRLLLIHTAATDGIVAVAEDGFVVAMETLPGRTSSEQLVPAVRRILAGKKWPIRTLSAVGVVVGPGSFTGVRVGLSAAKGLCEAGGVGLLAMSRLALLLQMGRTLPADNAAGSEQQSTGSGFLALLDAGRGDYYCGVSRDGRSEPEQIHRADDLHALLTGENQKFLRILTCESRVAANFVGATLLAEPGPVEMLSMANERLAAGEWSDVALADANYLRRTDAELLLEGR